MLHWRTIVRVSGRLVDFREMGGDYDREGVYGNTAFLRLFILSGTG